jgi:hypothetical protein
MILDGSDLRAVLAQTENLIELRNRHGWFSRHLTSDEALALNLDLFVGIGNRRRVRFLRPRLAVGRLNAGSRTTQRLRDDQGRQLAHPLIREHREMRRP